MLVPILVRASLFSLGSLAGVTASQTDASSGDYNSQNLPLPTPAINVNPSPLGSASGPIIADGSALLAEAGPSGTQADIEEKPASSQISVYTVKAGDTLSSIASLFNVPVSSIVWANDIQNGVITIGETLVVLPITGIRHTVQSGETLQSIAKTYNSNVHDIAQYNDLADNGALTGGQIIVIPDAELGGGSSLANQSSTKKSGSAPLQVVERRSAAGKPTAPLRGIGGPDLVGYFIWPVAGGIITQGLHGFDAVDIGARRGTDIYAAAAGTVIVSRANGGWNGGYGNYVVIQHPNGVQTLYAHASKVFVSVGEEVSQDQVIAAVGMTGEATGPHLHFEVRGAQNPFGDLSLGQSGSSN